MLHDLHDARQISKARPPAHGGKKADVRQIRLTMQEKKVTHNMSQYAAALGEALATRVGMAAAVTGNEDRAGLGFYCACVLLRLISGFPLLAL